MPNKNLWQYDYLVKLMDKTEKVVSVATKQGKTIARELLLKELEDQKIDNWFSFELINKTIIEDLTLSDTDIEILKEDLSQNDPFGFSKAINYDVFKDPVKANKINEILDKINLS
jgi:hypothetical protein